jgi:hypothetical protein
MNISYAYDGADLIIESIMRDVKNGFYIDLGSNHPIEHNNTYKLYQSGWTGIAVDGNSKFKPLWELHRPKDNFLTALVSSHEKKVNYTIFLEDTLSSIDPETIDRYKNRVPSNQYTIEEFSTITLQNIVDDYASNEEIHLLSVDVEGEDFNVLKGYNFSKKMPGCIVVEIKNYSLKKSIDNNIVKFLDELGYTLICKTPLDSFFVHKSKSYFNWIPAQLLT